MRRGVALRPARADELEACAGIWADGIGDYYRNRLHQPWEPGDLDPLIRLLAHLLRTDPEGFVVAVDGRAEDRLARPIGFGAAHRRGSTWFLAMLFVLPEFQAEGIGRAILERLMPGRDEGIAMGLATDSAQPISNALYSRYGIVPRLPAFQLLGRPARGAELPRLPEGTSVERFEGPVPSPFGVEGTAATQAGAPAPAGLLDLLATVDRQVLGHERPRDHAFMLAEGRRPFVFRSDDSVIGYGYASPVGRLGPVAVLDAALLAPVTAHLLHAVTPAGASAIWLPGDAGPVYGMLLRAGFRIEGYPALFCWTRPVADFSRYIPISLGLV